jgi:hypothetical protein
MVNPDEATKPNHQTSALTDKTTAPTKVLPSIMLRKMIASGKSVPSKASTK